MKKPSLKSLNPAQFLKAGPAREAKIQATEAKPLPKLNEYPANKIALALHPKKQVVKVTNIVERASGVKSYTLKATTDTPIAYFSAGQYIVVNLQIGDYLLTRPYSISSSPKQAQVDNEYELTVKRVDGGLASNYILDNWTVGTEVTISAPAGNFTYEPLRDAKTVVGLAGGSGITPFVSLAKAIADGDEDANLMLLYGCATKNDMLFKDELDAICEKCDKVKVVYVLSNDKLEGAEEGFLSAELIKKYAPEGDYSVFICGPQGMYNYLDTQLPLLGLRKKFIRHELFGEYRNPQANADYPECVEKSVKITVVCRGDATTIEADTNDTILVSIEKAGIPAPARCRSGSCGWCRAKLTSGDVYIPKDVDGRKLADYDYGYIHPCCSFPLSDITIEIFKK